MGNINLSELIAKQVEVSVNENIQKLIETNVNKCIEDVARDIFSYGSESRKALKHQLEHQIGIAISNLKVEHYNVLVSNAIQQSVNTQLIDIVQEDVKKLVLYDISLLEKREWTISEVVDKFKEYLVKDADILEIYDGDNFTVIIDQRSSLFTSIYFDVEAGQQKNECKYSISLSNFRGEESKVYHVNPLLISPYDQKNEFEKLLFALYASSAKIDISNRNYDTYISIEDND